MKGNLKRLVSVLLVLCLLISTAACGKREDNKKKEETVNENVEKENKEEVYEEVKPEATALNIVTEGVSSYKIVIPAKPSDNVVFASEELQTFFAEATGVKLPIISEKAAAGTENMISLGNTTVAKALGVKVTEKDDIGTTGYVMKTVGSSVAIVSNPSGAWDGTGDDEGVINGVYDFLYDAVGFKVYADDEIAYEKKTTVPLYKYDLAVRPSFDLRSLMYVNLTEDGTYARRMRLFNMYNATDGTAYRVVFTKRNHTIVNLLGNEAENRKLHPDWYATDGKNVCCMAGPELETAVAESIIENFYKTDTKFVYFRMSETDNSAGCSCSECLKYEEMYGSYAGLMISFYNKILAKVKAWVAANQPGREVRFLAYAYAQTQQPPMKKDANGHYTSEPAHEDVIPADGLYIQYAPLGMDFSEPITKSGSNANIYEQYQHWKILCGDKLYTYSYDTNFMTNLANFPNFEVSGQHMKFFDELGVDMYYSQGASDSRTPNFSQMRIFVESQLMWNTKKDYDTLVNEFMQHYYRDAAPAMRKVYDLIRKTYADAKKNGITTGGVFTKLATTGIYSRDTLKQMKKYLDEAMAAVEPLRNTQNDLFKKLYYRIKQEEISYLYMELDLYNLYHTPEELRAMAEEFYFLCAKLRIFNYMEVTPHQDKFSHYL